MTAQTLEKLLASKPFADRLAAITPKLTVTKIVVGCDCEEYKSKYWCKCLTPGGTQVKVLYTLEGVKDNTENLKTIKFSLPIGYFPGCCGVQVIHHISQPAWGDYPPTVSLRQRGIGGLFFDLVVENMRQDAVDSCSHGLILAVTTDMQIEGKTMMVNRKWTELHQFTNPNTGRRCTLWMKDLTK